MISDEFETFGNNHFWRGQTKVKIFIQKIIHFWKIKNIHSKKSFFKIQNITSRKLFIFSKSRIFIPKNIHFLKRGRIVQGYTRWTWNVLNGKMEKERKVESRIEKSSLLSFCGREGTNWQKRWVAREKVFVEVQIITRSVDKITLPKYFKPTVQIMQQQTSWCIQASQTPRLPDEYFLRLLNFLTPRIRLSKSGTLKF